MKTAGFNESLSDAGKRVKSAWIVLLFSVLYFLLVKYTTGFRGDHLLFIVLINALYFFSDTTQRFVKGFSFFIVYWIIYDSMKAWPNFEFRPVDIQNLYELEKQLFGIRENGTTLIPSEFFRQHHGTIPDLVSSFF